MISEIKSKIEKDNSSTPMDPEYFNKSVEHAVSVIPAPKKLSQLLVSPSNPMPKSARIEPRKMSSNFGYNLTMDDLNKRSVASKSQNTI